MTEHLLLLEEAVDRIAAVGRRGHQGRRLVDDESVQYRLGRSVADGGRGEHTERPARRHRPPCATSRPT
jgi:hypothetical protein